MTKISNTEVEIGEFKGNPTISIYETDEKGERKPYPFTFGVKKAILIAKHINEIREFAGLPVKSED